MSIHCIGQIGDFFFFFFSLLGLTSLLPETAGLLRDSNGPVTPFIRQHISWCHEFSAHKEQTQAIHQTATGALHYTDRVEIWYPSSVSEGMGRDNPGNT